MQHPRKIVSVLNYLEKKASEYASANDLIGGDPAAMMQQRLQAQGQAEAAPEPTAAGEKNVNVAVKAAVDGQDIAMSDLDKNKLAMTALKLKVDEQTKQQKEEAKAQADAQKQAQAQAKAAAAPAAIPGAAPAPAPGIAPV